jgi:hypothetical protein
MTTRANPSPRRSRLSLGRIAVMTALVPLAASQGAFAGFIGPQAGSVAGITYAVENVNPAGGAVYDPVTGQLVNIGGLPGGAGYGSLGAPVTPVSTFGGGVAAPAAALTPAGFGGTQPAVPGKDFGDTIGGSARLAASTFGGGGGAGVFWLNPTYIADKGADGRASVNFSQGIANFKDTTADVKVPGVGLAIIGTLGGQGPAGAFVAATLDGRFSVFNAAGGLINSFSTSVAIVSDGPGPRGDFVTATPSVGGSTLFSNFITPGSNTFYAWGVDILPAVAIPAGGSVRLDGTLSLVADPDVLNLSLAAIPTGINTGDLTFNASIPEPTSIVMMVLGIAATLGAGSLCRKATTARADRA